MDVESFLERCQPLEGGFFGSDPQSLWRLGAVLFAASDGRFAAIQKAPKPGYEFADQWALPGGMIRAASGMGAARPRIDAALEDRVRAEAGLDYRGAIPLTGLGPVVTSYTVAEIRRFTLVVGFESTFASQPVLQSLDRSIQAASWMPHSANLQAFAPANRVIIGHRLWPYLDTTCRAAGRVPLMEALEICASWSAEMSIAPAPAPWASDPEIADWCRSWPGAK